MLAFRSYAPLVGNAHPTN